VPQIKCAGAVTSKKLLFSKTLKNMLINRVV
jgi:hypothetical protein